MKKIVAFYYLSYPDDMPADPENAYSEVYVEVGGPGATVDSFDETYSFHVYTPQYIANAVRRGHAGFLAQRSVIIVQRFDNATVRGALEALLPSIEEYGTRVG
jgi:hypothetical protein